MLTVNYENLRQSLLFCENLEGSFVKINCLAQFNETFGLRDKLAVACIGLFMIAAFPANFRAISACARTVA